MPSNRSALEVQFIGQTLAVLHSLSVQYFITHSISCALRYCFKLRGLTQFKNPFEIHIDE